MKHAFIQRDGASRLIVIFAGWGMDAKPFEGLAKPGYDILAVWDYRTLDFDPAWTAGYSEVCVLAWSMGVIAAQHCHKALGDRVTARIAVGGTPRPVDDEYGIPTAIFRGTLDGLNERTLERFYRRMCGGAAEYAKFVACRPNRPAEELHDELQAVSELAAAEAASPAFDHYVLTKRDAIFPPANQRKAWYGTCEIHELDSPHLPDFQLLLDRFVIDKALVAERFGSSRDSYDSHAAAQAMTATYLAALLDDKDTRTILHNPDANVLEIGCGTGLLTRRLTDMQPRARMRFMDIATTAPAGIPADAYTCADAETAMMDMTEDSLDLIASASTMQWFNSPERFVRRCMRALRPGGFLAVSTFGADNLREVAEITGVGLRLASADTWRTILARTPGAETVVLKEKTIQVPFASMRDALRSLSRTGVNAISRSPGWLRHLPDGACTLNYKPLFILLRKS